jgi:hypothetical protein
MTEKQKQEILANALKDCWCHPKCTAKYLGVNDAGEVTL